VAVMSRGHSLSFEGYIQRAEMRMDSMMDPLSLWHSLEEGALLVFSGLDFVRPAVGL
jgi:hypothetical protein